MKEKNIERTHHIFDDEKSKVNSRPKVSIVIPVYGVEPYIEKCIKSLQKQTLKEIEMIFIDDCGPDNAIKIVEEYAKTDDRIKIIYNEQNQGAGKSRNKGIDAATGEYLGFVDPDDWVDSNFYEVLYNRAKNDGYDIVKSDRIQVRVRNNGEVRYKNSEVNDRMMKNLKQMKPLYVWFTSEHQTAIYNTDMCHKYGIHNGSTSHSENSVFLLKASYYAKSFCFESDVAYYYLQRENSSVHVFDYKKFFGELESFKEQMEFAVSEIKQDKDFFEFLEKKINFLLRRYNELKRTPELKKYCPEFFNKLCEIVDMVENKEKLRKCGRLFSYIVDHKEKQFLLVTYYENIYKVMRKGKRFLKRRLLNIKLKLFSKKKKAKVITDNNQTTDVVDENELFYLQNYRGAIIFTKEFLEIDPKFAKNYINAFKKMNDQYNCDLKRDSDLYREHLEKMAKGELCWRYSKRLGHISLSTIYKDEDGELALKGEILGSEKVISKKHFYIHPQVDRKIINDCVILSDYIRKKGTNKNEIFGELVQYLDYLFDYFATDNVNELKGLAYDAFPFNCMLMEGHVYQLFDLEFEYKENLDKGYLVYKCAAMVKEKLQHDIYLRLCEYYKIAPRWEYWNRFNFRMWMETIADADDSPANQENAELFSKYFI